MVHGCVYVHKFRILFYILQMARCTTVTCGRGTRIGPRAVFMHTKKGKFPDIVQKTCTWVPFGSQVFHGASVLIV